MKHETAGDPMTGMKWTHRTTEKIAAELRSMQIDVSPRTVAKLLTEMGFSLRVNNKKLSSGSPKLRDEQFTRIADRTQGSHGAANPSPSKTMTSDRRPRVWCTQY